MSNHNRLSRFLQPVVGGLALPTGNPTLQLPLLDLLLRYMDYGHSQRIERWVIDILRTRFSFPEYDVLTECCCPSVLACRSELSSRHGGFPRCYGQSKLARLVSRTKDTDLIAVTVIIRRQCGR